jgi:hypothetical protein
VPSGRWWLDAEKCPYCHCTPYDWGVEGNVTITYHVGCKPVRGINMKSPCGNGKTFQEALDDWNSQCRKIKETLINLGKFVEEALPY